MQISKMINKFDVSSTIDHNSKPCLTIINNHQTCKTPCINHKQVMRTPKTNSTILQTFVKTMQNRTTSETIHKHLTKSKEIRRTISEIPTHIQHNHQEYKKTLNILQSHQQSLILCKQL